MKRGAGVFLSGSLYMQQEIREGGLFRVETERNPFPFSQVFVVFRGTSRGSLDQPFIPHSGEACSAGSQPDARLPRRFARS